MNVTELPWWPVRRLYVIGPPGLDADALGFTLSRRTASPTLLLPVPSAQDIPESSPDGVLVVVLSSPRHPDAASHALAVAGRSLCVVVIGLQLSPAEQAELDVHGIPQIYRNQVSTLVSAIHAGVFVSDVRDPKAAASPHTLPDTLTRRELDLVRFLHRVPFSTRRQVARHFGISEQTAKVHLAHVRTKLGIKDTGRQALQRAILRYAVPDE